MLLARNEFFLTYDFSTLLFSSVFRANDTLAGPGGPHVLLYSPDLLSAIRVGQSGFKDRILCESGP